MYIPVCDDALKPMIGMKFSTLVEAVDFSEHYARSVGFWHSSRIEFDFRLILVVD